jgi:hypothetical protein
MPRHCWPPRAGRSRNLIGLSSDAAALVVLACWVSQWGANMTRITRRPLSATAIVAFLIAGSEPVWRQHDGGHTDAPVMLETAYDAVDTAYARTRAN